MHTKRIWSLALLAVLALWQFAFPGTDELRHVTSQTKEFVKARDGYKCVWCGSREKLEVDEWKLVCEGNIPMAIILASAILACALVVSKIVLP